MTAMNIQLSLVVAMLIFAVAQAQGDANKTWTEEELEAIFANAPSNVTDPTPVLITSHNYTCEIHHVTTPDGYVLEMHRIPGSPTCPPASGKPVAFVMHGLLTSSADWVVQGPERALAYMLADAGYDVWLGNARGNSYSTKHIPPVSRKKFWAFSWHEIGYYDLPAMIDYALNETGQGQVVYIGHSQGTTAFYVMASTRPEYNAKIKAMFSLAPIAYMGHIFSPVFRVLTPATTPIQRLANLIGLYEFVPSPRLVQLAGAALCSNDAIGILVCRNILFILGGFDERQLDIHLLPTIFGHFPDSVSVRQLAHYGQEIQSHKFRQYDYGQIENRRRYGSTTPPDYNLSSITAPVHLYYSGNDWLSDVQDVTQLYNELGNPVEMYRVPWEKWQHTDYTYGRDAKTLVYEHIIDTLANEYGLPSSCS